MNAWIEFSAGPARAWLVAMARASLEGGVALLLAWAICRLAARMPARFKCWLWRAAYAKALASLLWATPVELPLLRPRAVASGAAVVIPTHIDTAPMSIAQSSVFPPAERDTVAVVAPASVSPPPSRSAKWTVATGMIWSLCVTAILVRIYGQWIAAGRLRRASPAVRDPSLVVEFKALSRRAGLRRSPELLQNETVGSPILLGFLRPAVVVPDDFGELPHEQLRLTLAHELSHVARRDLAWRLFASVVETLFFFHPLVWLARRESRLAQEMAADRHAVELTRAAPVDYAQALLAVAARGFFPAPALSAGVASARINLERRLLAMNTQAHWSRRRFALGAFALAFCSAVAVPPWKLVAQTAREEKPVAQDPAKPQEDQPIKPAAPRGGAPVAGTVELPASLSAAEMTLVPARAPGILETISVADGAVVKKGQTLFTLDRGSSELQVRAAKAEYEEKTVILRRNKEMFQRKVIGELEMLDAELNVAISQARLSLAEQEIDDRIIKAPADGVLLFKRRLLVGEGVKPGDSLATVINQGDVRAELSVPHSLRSLLRVGLSVELKTDAYPKETFTGRVTFISPEGNLMTGTTRVVATISNPNQRALAGMTGKIRISMPADENPNEKQPADPK